MTTAYINKIAHQVPPHDVHQHFVDFAVAGFEQERSRQVFSRMVERSHISHRWAAMRNLDEFYKAEPNTVNLYTRAQEFERLAPQLAIATVADLDLGPLADEITHLVVVTSTGFFNPGLDYQIIEHFGISPSVERSQLAFMGCYAGVNGLKLAHHFVRSEPTSKVLVVTIELCSLHLQSSQSLETMLSYLIFSDGCAAAVVSAEPSGLAIDSFKAVTIPNTKELMTLKIGERSIEMFLSGKVPLELGRALSEEQTVRQILPGTSREAIDIWAIHPGGRSILDAVAGALQLAPDELAISREVLDNYGNMASATILFVLAEIMRQRDAGQLSGRGAALAFGPGLVAETMLFRA